MLQIRKALQEDQVAIFNIVAKVLMEYGLKIDPKKTDLDIQDINAHYFEKGGWFAVLENKRKIIGCYGLYKINDDVCELRKMYLLSAFQGRGLGKMLMSDAEKSALELGFKAMVLETNTKLDKALHLYEKFGFEEYIPDHLSDRCNLALRKQLK